MPRVAFEFVIPVSERPRSFDASDRAANGIDANETFSINILYYSVKVVAYSSGFRGIV